jgi:hypothetical protein
MEPSNRPPQAVADAAIDPAKAWMLGVLVDEDGSLRPVPSLSLSWHPLDLDERQADVMSCTCPDYCDLEHGAEPD